MQSQSDARLLRQYAEHGSEGAFAEIVSRHTDLVYSAALRQVGSPDAAADIAQQAFIILAHGARTLAGKLAGEASLAGWLCRTARNLALNHRRDEFRRQSRERQAMEYYDPATETAPDWERLRPVLDEAMAELKPPDYDALVMRFFQNRDLRSVGRALGLSDDAAQKRVSRALDRLRGTLVRRGVATSAVALSVTLSANTVQAAPAGLAASLTTTALATPASLALATTKIIVMTTLQKAIVGTCIVAALGVGIYQLTKTSPSAAPNSANQSPPPRERSTTRTEDPAAPDSHAKTRPPKPSGEAAAKPPGKSPEELGEKAKGDLKTNLAELRAQFMRRIDKLAVSLSLNDAQKAGLVVWLDGRIASLEATALAELNRTELKAADQIDTICGIRTLSEGLTAKELEDQLAGMLTADQNTALTSFKDRKIQTKSDSMALNHLAKIQGTVDLDPGQRVEVHKILAAKAAEMVRAKQGDPDAAGLFDEDDRMDRDAYSLGMREVMNRALSEAAIEVRGPEGVVRGGVEGNKFDAILREEYGRRIEDKVDELRPVLNDAQLEQYRAALRKAVAGAYSGVDLKLDASPAKTAP